MFNFPAKKWLNVIALLFMVSAVYLSVKVRPDEPLANLRYLGESAGRVVDRNMAFYEAYHATPIWEQAVHTFLFGTRDYVTDRAVDMCRDVLAYFKRHPQLAESWVILNTQGRLLVLLAETGQWRDFDQLASELEQNPEEDTLIGAIRFAYGKAQDERGLLEIQYGARLLPLGWASKRIAFLIADRVGQRNQALILKDNMHTEGRAIRAKLRWLYSSVFVSLAVGMTVLIGSGFFRRFSIWPRSVLEQPWPFLAGVAVVIVSIPASILLITATDMLQRYVVETKLITLWRSPVVYLPMLWLLRRYLMKPRGLGFRNGFGLTVRIPWRHFAGIVLALLTVDWLGATVIAYACWQLGLDTNWANSVHESTMFGNRSESVAKAIELVLWAPFFEELAYRGLVYVSLRSLLKPWPAILLSALLFGFLHFYSVSGLLTVFWSGIVLAYSFERFHSLLPGIAVHALGNMLFLTTVWLFYS